MEGEKNFSPEQHADFIKCILSQDKTYAFLDFMWILFLEQTGDSYSIPSNVSIYSFVVLFFFYTLI